MVKNDIKRDDSKRLFAPSLVDKQIRGARGALV